MGDVADEIKFRPGSAEKKVPRYRCMLFYPHEEYGVLHYHHYINVFSFDETSIIPWNEKLFMVPEGVTEETRLQQSWSVTRFMRDKVAIALLLLNTRNSPFSKLTDADLDKQKQGTPAQVAQFEKLLVARNRKDRRQLKTMKIRFDLSRLLEKFPGLSRAELIKKMQRHFVSGHIKMLKDIGPRWWNAFFRGEKKPGIEDKDLMPRNKIIGASKPARPLSTPDGILQVYTPESLQ